MKERLPKRVKHTENNMIRQPGDEEPAGPVRPPQKVYTAEEGQKPDGEGGEELRVKEIPGIDLPDVIRKTAYADNDKQPAKNRYFQRPLLQNYSPEGGMVICVAA